MWSVASNSETIEHLELQHDDGRGGKACGCLKAKTGSWMLCAYHDGYDEGISLIRAILEDYR